MAGQIAFQDPLAKRKIIPHLALGMFYYETLSDIQGKKTNI